MARHRIRSIAFKKQVVQEYAAGRPSAAWPPGPLHATLWWAGTRGPLFSSSPVSWSGGTDKLQPCLRGPLLSSFLRLSEGFQPCRLFVGLDGSALRVGGLLRHRRELSLRARALF